MADIACRFELWMHNSIFYQIAMAGKAIFFPEFRVMRLQIVYGRNHQ
jgi:hypothetical protein